jgi:Cd2+/Zn2+-exporting ATPase
MARAKTVVFDKTGTLTLGHPTVVEVTRFAENVDKHVLTYVAALEQYSRHPMAEALVNAASEQGLDFRRLHVENVQEVSGKGIVGIVEDVKIGVGNNELMRACSTNHLDFPDTIDDKHSCVFVSVNDSITSAFCFADDVRHDAVEAVKLLRSNGVRTVMLTGEKASIAKEIAGKLEMDEVYAELLPEGKLKIIDRLKVKHGLVAMVGDGVNDAPALAASDVGIAMGGSGVDVALESADVVLVNDELVKIPYLRKLSQRAVKISRQNIAASLGVKIAIGALGFLGIIPLWFAVAAGDDGVTMLLLLNTLRLMRVK